MPKQSLATPAQPNTLHQVLECLHRDVVAIAIVTLLLAVLGAAAGVFTHSVTSTAQLILAPPPFQAMPEEDELAAMVADPMDVKTAVLLCTSDETLAATRDRLNEEMTLSKPVKNLRQIEQALSYTVTIAKETPYEVLYSPIIELTAKAASPADARTMVDAWAQECVNAARTYQEAYQLPMSAALRQEGQTTEDAYVAAEQEYAAFTREHIIPLYEDRVKVLIETMGELEKSRTTLLQSVNEARAKADAYGKSLASEEPKLTLEWGASEPLSGALSRVAGTTPAPTGGDGPEGAIVRGETVNTTYWAMQAERADAEAEWASCSAQLDALDLLLEARRKELDKTQATLSAALVEEQRLKRVVELYGGVYMNTRGKATFAQVAEQLADTPQLQVLSGGAEWQKSRLARALANGILAAFFGLLMAASASIAMRLVLKPALEQG